MTRVAVFVDAGYLYTGGATALIGPGRSSREAMRLDQEKVIARLKETAEEITKTSLLRIYWYDGQVRGEISPQQKSLAKTDNVKVKLGVVIGGKQKGVDSLIITDLIELARNHAISDAVLLSGDEDLRVGVQIAQSFGVRVHLIGIETSEGNQSRLLLEEADTTRDWSKDDIGEILSIKPGIDLDKDSSSASGADEIFDDVVAEIVSHLTHDTLTNLGSHFKQNKDIPKDHDVALLKGCQEKIDRRLGDQEKYRVRAKFRAAIHQEKSDRDANSNQPSAPG